MEEFLKLIELIEFLKLIDKYIVSAKSERHAGRRGIRRHADSHVFGGLMRIKSTSVTILKHW